MGDDPTATAKKMEAKPTFSEATMEVYEELKPTWRSDRYRNQWIDNMKSLVFPALGDVTVDEITGPMVRDAVASFWHTTPETGRRTLRRIGTVMDFAHSKGWCDQELPMRSIKRGLGKQRVRKVSHPAMEWKLVPNFIIDMPTLGKQNDLVLSCLEFLILTAARSGEAREAVWGEIDLENAVWSIPADRMKGGIAHRVPLSKAAITILERRLALRRDAADDDELIFSNKPRGRKKASPMYAYALSRFMERASVKATPHGFRSSFRDWCSDEAVTPREVAEAALAHEVGGVEGAYARSDHFDRRVVVMDRWSRFLRPELHADETVVPIRAAG